MNDSEKIEMLKELKYSLPKGIKITGLKKALKPIKNITKDML